MASNGMEQEAADSKPDAMDDLKTLPVAEVQKRLGSSTTEEGSPTGTLKGVAHSSIVDPFHSDADSEHPVYHDRSDCPYGREIKNNGVDTPGTDDRRLCDWCANERNSAA